MANPGWVDGWSQDDIDLLISKRDVEGKTFRQIGEEMNRPLKTCYDRYIKATRDREPIATVVPECARSVPLHEQLGISTYVHRQAILTDLIPGGRGKKGEDGWGYDEVNRCWSNNHLFRASITLPKVFV